MSEEIQNVSAAAVLSEGRGGFVGIKAGMTQVYDAEGMAQPVTVIDLRPVVITQVKTVAKDGYNALQVGLLPSKKGAANRPESGHLKPALAALSADAKSKLGQSPEGFLHYQEFRMPADAQMEAFAVGQLLSPEFVQDGDRVDVTAISKGKGFQGVMKRHNFAGGPAAHGASVVHRAPGSIGNRADPSKVFKGKKMAGHMGHERVTIQNVKVVRLDAEQGLLLLSGGVPGPRSGLVTVRKAIRAQA